MPSCYCQVGAGFSPGLGSPLRGSTPYAAGQLRALAPHKASCAAIPVGRRRTRSRWGGIPGSHIVSTDGTERRGALRSPCSLPSLTQSCGVWGTLQPAKGGSWPLLRGGGGVTVVCVVFFIGYLSWEAACVLVL